MPRANNIPEMVHPVIMRSTSMMSMVKSMKSNTNKMKEQKRIKDKMPLQTQRCSFENKIDPPLFSKRTSMNAVYLCISVPSKSFSMDVAANA